MKEYTLTYTVDITEVIKPTEEIREGFDDKNAIANWIGAKLNVDDVHVKNVKVFERDL